MRDNWTTVVCDIQETRGRRTKLKDVLHFIEKKTRAILDPIFGEINMPVSVENKAKLKAPQKSSRGSSFTTTVTYFFEKA